MKTARRWIVAGLMASVLIAGCGKQPTQQMNAAEGRVEDLKNQGAALYFTEGFDRLTNDLAAAMEEVQEQDTRLIKNYEKAKEMLARVMKDAEAYGRILPPIQETQSAIDSVAKDDAALYAQEEMKRLSDDFEAALAEARNQNAQPVADYQRAMEMLATVKMDAEGLASIISGRKEDAKNRTLTAQTEAKAAVDEAKRLLETAMKGKKPSPDMEGLSSRLKIVEGSIGEIQTALDRGEYLGAYEKATMVKEKAADIKKQGEQNLAQMQSKKKSR